MDSIELAIFFAHGFYSQNKINSVFVCSFLEADVALGCDVSLGLLSKDPQTITTGLEKQSSIWITRFSPAKMELL